MSIHALKSFSVYLLLSAFSLVSVSMGGGECFAQSSHSKSVRVSKNEQGRRVVYGNATHYSRNLEGTRTAVGTRYRNNKYTAASNFFKLRTWVRVTRLSNGRSVTVYINDRMHPSMASRGRVIDLSIAAADYLHFLGGAGITRVKVEEIPKPDAPQQLPLNANQSAPFSEISAYDR